MDDGELVFASPFLRFSMRDEIKPTVMVLAETYQELGVRNKKGKSATIRRQPAVRLR